MMSDQLCVWSDIMEENYNCFSTGHSNHTKYPGTCMHACMPAFSRDYFCHGIYQYMCLYGKDLL